MVEIENHRQGPLLAIAVVAAAALGAAVAATLLLSRLGFTGPTRDGGVIRTRGIVVQDRDGRRRVSIGVSPSGNAYCTLFGQNNVPELGLTVDSAGRPFILLSRSGSPMIDLSIDHKGDPSLGMHCDHSSVTLAAGPKRAMGVLLSGSRANPNVLSLTVSDQVGRVTLGSPHGTTTAIDLSVDQPRSASSLDMFGSGRNAYLDVGSRSLALNIIGAKKAGVGMSVNRHSQPAVYVQDQRGMKFFRATGPYSGP